MEKRIINCKTSTTTKIDDVRGKIRVVTNTFNIFDALKITEECYYDENSLVERRVSGPINLSVRFDTDGLEHPVISQSLPYVTKIYGDDVQTSVGLGCSDRTICRLIRYKGISICIEMYSVNTMAVLINVHDDNTHSDAEIHITVRGINVYKTKPTNKTFFNKIYRAFADIKPMPNMNTLMVDDRGRPLTEVSNTKCCNKQNENLRFVTTRYNDDNHTISQVIHNISNVNGHINSKNILLTKYLNDDNKVERIAMYREEHPSANIGSGSNLPTIKYMHDVFNGGFASAIVVVSDKKHGKNTGYAYRTIFGKRMEQNPL